MQGTGEFLSGISCIILRQSPNGTQHVLNTTSKTRNVSVLWYSEFQFYLREKYNSKFYEKFRSLFAVLYIPDGFDIQGFKPQIGK